VPVTRRHVTRQHTKLVPSAPRSLPTAQGRSAVADTVWYDSSPPDCLANEFSCANTGSSVLGNISFYEGLKKETPLNFVYFIEEISLFLLLSANFRTQYHINEQYSVWSITLYFLTSILRIGELRNMKNTTPLFQAASRTELSSKNSL